MKSEFELRYLTGDAPWDTGETPPEVKAQIEEGKLSPGRALDLGCGTGTNTIYLVQHGWEAVGVDIAFLAILQAHWKAWRASVDVRFHRASVTHMPFLEEPFDLALDIGCLHSLPSEKRAPYAAEVTRLVRSEGLYMIYAFTPRPGRPGVAPEEVRRLFTPAFRIERQEGGEDPTGPSSAWYWLRKIA